MDVVETTHIAERESNELQKIHDRRKRPFQPNAHREPIAPTLAKRMPIEHEVVEKCRRCRKRHGGTCYWNTGACFGYGQIIPLFCGCPTKKDTPAAKPIDDQQCPKVKAYVYAITERDAEVSKAIISSIISLFAHTARVLIDLESTHSLYPMPMADMLVPYV